MLHRVKEERNILQTIKIRKADWIGYILRWNCLLQHVIEGKIQGICDFVMALMTSLSPEHFFPRSMRCAIWNLFASVISPNYFLRVCLVGKNCIVLAGTSLCM